MGAGVGVGVGTTGALFSLAQEPITPTANNRSTVLFIVVFGLVINYVHVPKDRESDASQRLARLIA